MRWARKLEYTGFRIKMFNQNWRRVREVHEKNVSRIV